MFCPKCGVEIPDDSQFCRKCGKGLGSSAVSVGSGAAAAPAPIPATPKSKIRWPFAVAAILIAVFVGLAMNARRTTSASTQFIKQQHITTIDEADAEVKANSYYYWKLQVPAGATGVHFEGNFTASGGTGNDVEAYVLPEDDFVNWQNHHAARTFYNSGKVTVGKINLNLPIGAGTYYLVFDNRFSLLSKKDVEVKAALTYYQ